MEVGKGGPEYEEPEIHKVRNDALVKDAAERLIEGGEACRKERSQVFDYGCRVAHADAALDMNSDKAVEIFDRGAKFFTLEDDEQFGTQEVPHIFRTHVVETKALKGITSGEVGVRRRRAEERGRRSRATIVAQVEMINVGDLGSKRKGLLFLPLLPHGATSMSKIKAREGGGGRRCRSWLEIVQRRGC